MLEYSCVWLGRLHCIYIFILQLFFRLTFFNRSLAYVWVYKLIRTKWFKIILASIYTNLYLVSKTSICCTWWTIYLALRLVLEYILYVTSRTIKTIEFLVLPFNSSGSFRWIVEYINRANDNIINYITMMI